MIRSQLVLDVYDEIIVDNFAGGGGASSGIEEATGRHVDHAINHDPDALGMHRINHPQTVHHCEDVFDVDPAKVAGRRRVGFGWFSPDCKHFSKAKGGKPLDRKIRGLVLVILRWAAIRTRVITMENVEEIQTYGPLLQHPKHKAECSCGKPCGTADPKFKGRTWQAFLDALGPGLDPNHPDLPEMVELLRGTISKEQLVKGFGYHVEVKEIRACDFGTPTIRKRLFMIARCDGMPIVWPKATHAPRPEARAQHLKPYRAIAECIDWERPCPSIFLSPKKALLAKCRRPLKTPTLRRIAAGIDRFVLKAQEPFIICLTHHGSDRNHSVNEPAKTATAAHRGERALVQPSLAPFIADANRPQERRVAPANGPMSTLCSGIKGGHFQVVSSHLLKFQAKSDGQPMDKPGPTITANSYIKKPGGAAPFGLCAANMLKLRGDPATHPSAPVSDPGHTSSAGGQHHALSSCYLAQHNAGNNTVPGREAREPISTLSAKGSQQQVVAASMTAYYGNETDGQGLNESLRTATAKPRFGLTQSEVATVMTPDQIAGAHRVAKFLRRFGVQFEGDFAMVGEFVIYDIGMRMLTPRELFRAQGFPEGYVIDRAWLVNPKTGEIIEEHLTKEEQIRMCGNSVCPQVARALTAANVPELCVWKRNEKRRFYRTRDRKPVFA